MRLQFVEQKIQTVSIFGDQEDSRGIPIDPVDERRGKNRSAGFGSEIVVGQLDYRHFGRFVVARMDIDFWRFVDDQYRIVLVEDPFRKLEVRHYWQNRPFRDLAELPELLIGEEELQTVSSFDTVLIVDTFAIDFDFSGPDQLVNARKRG